MPIAATVCFLGSNRRKEEEEEDVYVVQRILDKRRDCIATWT